MNAEDITPEERETAEKIGYDVEQLRDLRAAAKRFEKSLPWWRRALIWVQSR